MSKQTAKMRAAAAKAVASVMSNGRSLDKALVDHGGDYEGANRALFRQLAYGTLRHAHSLSHVLSKMVKKPLPAREAQVHALLLVGLHELAFMNTAQHAVVAQTVDATRFLSRPAMRGFVNALLRRFLREQEALMGALEADDAPFALRYSHPQWLVEQLQKDWPEDVEAILQANNERAPMWLRVNPLKKSMSEYLRKFNAETGIATTTVEWAAQALQLERAVPINKLPGFEQGQVSVQDVAAQMAAILCAPKTGMRVLDACAAPGGKSAHLAELGENKLDLLALDIDPERLTRVSETAQRLSLAIECVAADAAEPSTWWDGKPFDRILLDAPCSATGVIRRHPDIKWLRRASDIQAFADRQLAMLTALWPLLVPGGCLVYATCSVLRAENHDVIQAFAASADDLTLENELPNDNRRALMRADKFGMQFLPGSAGADGFFYAVLRKRN